MTKPSVHEVLATLCPRSVSRRELPRNLAQPDLHLFQHEFERPIPESRLLKLKNVKVSAEGLLFKGTQLLPESFAYDFGLREWRRHDIWRFLLKNHLFRKRRKIERPVLWITDYWSTGYFHWLTDALTRLLVARDQLDEVTLLLPAELATRDFVKSSLEAFGVKQMDSVRAGEFVECRSLLLPTHTAPSGHFRDETIHAVRSTLLSAFGDHNYAGEGERIYISRSVAGRRRIIDEEQLMPVLKSFDFQIVRAEDLSFAAQVSLFSRARYVVSNHGAGLTNMLFMPAGGSVLELRHAADYVNNCYFIMASALKLNYYYQLCRPGTVQADPHAADLLVSVAELTNNLAQLVAT